MNKITESKQKHDRYEMHKYWGKKPAKDLNHLIEKYSNPGDTLLDPFAGYGVFCCEAYLLQRNIVANDLNPIATFIQRQLLEKNVDLSKVKRDAEKIIKKFTDFNNSWFSFDVNGEKCVAVNVLRNRDNKIVKCRYIKSGRRGMEEYSFSEQQRQKYFDKESNYVQEDWIPTDSLIENSRISAKKGMTISDLFTIRTLACHSRLLKLINEISSGNERNLILLAFTSNLANCSKLVPPIGSRGDMAQGAWMTGFYWGESYLENNVLHYFENRIEKIINGKNDYLKEFSSLFQGLGLNDVGAISSIEKINRYSYGYVVHNLDAKKLPIKDDSIDFVFTDPPYGDSVPYFEQSIIWNCWLKFSVDYKNEIVVSNSPLRNKDIDKFSDDISVAIKEIYRVLKPGKMFAMTFHSLCGKEWTSITNGCIDAGFVIDDIIWLTQKTFTPRQLNRIKTVKGDVLMVLKKTESGNNAVRLDYFESKALINEMLRESLNRSSKQTNEIFLDVVKSIFDQHFLLSDVNFFEELEQNFTFNGEKWSKK